MMRQFKALITEDDELMIDNLLKLLANEGYEIATVTDGSEALDKLRKNNYDMLITDRNHPGLDGLELLKEAKKLKKDIIMIMLRGSLTTQDAINEAKEIGCFACIPKPFDVKHFKVTIKKAFTSLL